MSEDDDLIARHHSGAALTPDEWTRATAIITATERANAQAKRFAKFKENQKALGRIRRDYFATVDEHETLTATLRDLRTK
jgi:hypothetical protein